MSEIYENLSNASTGKELVDQINRLGLETVIAELSETEAAAIVEKFNADPDFGKFVEEVTTNTMPAPP